MIRWRRRIALGAIILSSSIGSARADRAVVPTDALDDWAIELDLHLVGGSRTRVFYGDDMPEVAKVQGADYNLGTRVWPGGGLYVGMMSGIAAIDEANGDEGSAYLVDLRLDAGLRRRPFPSIPVAVDVALTLPAGSDETTDDRVDLELRGLVGLSFTPRHDFYIQFPVGMSGSDRNGDRGGVRGGFLVGMAYQRARFVLVAQGYNLWHREDHSSYLTTGGQIGIGWEVTPGLTLMLNEFAHDTNGYEVVTTNTEPAAFGALIDVVWVFYPGSRQNELRRSDPNRGAGFLWWNPHGRPVN